MLKNINHVFYKFEYPVNSGFSNNDFIEWLEKITDYRLNHDDIENSECTWISYLSSFEWVTSCTFHDEVKKSLFYWRFVKGKYWDQIHLYSKSWDFSDIEDDTDFIWRESDKRPDEMVVRDFFYVFKLTYDSINKTLKGIVSRPTLLECMWKNELGFVIKKIIQNNFQNLEDGWDTTFWLEEILWQQQLSAISSDGLTISYVETKKIKNIMEDLEQDVDWYWEEDTIDITVSINKTNSSKIENLVRRFKPSRVIDSPIKRLVIKNNYWKIINLESFCYSFIIEDLDIIDWIIVWESKAYYLNKLSRFVIEKIFPNI